MFVGVQVDIEGEGWMVRVVDKCKLSCSIHIHLQQI